MVLKTQGSSSLKDNIITVFGMNIYNCLEPVAICKSDSCKVEGFLSKPGQGSGRNLGDRQYFFVNDRPVDMPKVSKLVNELYKGANSRQYPIAIMNFIVPTRACDVNVTPDKRKVFFSDECSILHALREGLQEIYSPNNASYSVNKVEQLIEPEKSGPSSGAESCMFLEQLSPDGNGCIEILNEQQISKGNTPKTVEVDTLHSDALEGLVHSSNENGKGNFTLKAHDDKSADRLSKFNCMKLIGPHNVPTEENCPSPSRVMAKNITEDGESDSRSRCIQSSLNKFVTVSKRKYESIARPLTEMPLLRNQSLHCQMKKSNSDMDAVDTRSPVRHHLVDDIAKLNKIEPFKCNKADKVSKEIENILSSEGNTNERPREVCQCLVISVCSVF